MKETKRLNSGLDDLRKADQRIFLNQFMITLRSTQPSAISLITDKLEIVTFIIRWNQRPDQDWFKLCLNHFWATLLIYLRMVITCLRPAANSPITLWVRLNQSYSYQTMKSLQKESSLRIWWWFKRVWYMYIVIIKRIIYRMIIASLYCPPSPTSATTKSCSTSKPESPFAQELINFVFWCVLIRISSYKLLRIMQIVGSIICREPGKEELNSAEDKRSSWNTSPR